MITLNTNVPAQLTQNVLRRNENDMDQAMQRLSTGKRINSGADDGAGLAMSTRIGTTATANLRGEHAANMTISMLKHFAAAGEIITDILVTMKELAAVGSNATNSIHTRMAVDANFNSLGQEWGRIASETKWGGVAAMDTFDNSFALRLDDGPSTMTLTLRDWSPTNSTAGQNATGASGASSDDDNADITLAWSFDQVFGSVRMPANVSRSASHLQTVTASQNALTKLDGTIASIAAEVSGLGAYINRLEFAADNSRNMATELSRAVSKIVNTDYARETTELARTQIISQAATAMLVQANKLPKIIETLLS